MKPHKRLLPTLSLGKVSIAEGVLQEEALHLLGLAPSSRGLSFEETVSSNLFSPYLFPSRFSYIYLL